MSDEQQVVEAQEAVPQDQFITQPEQQEAQPEQKPVEQEQKPENKEQDRLAAKFAALSRKEKQIRQRELQMQQMQKEQEQKIAEMQKQLEEERSYRSKLKQNPLKALEEEGYDYEKLTEMQLNNQNPTVEMQLRRMQEEMDRKYSTELENLKKQLQEKEEKEKKEREESTLSTFKKQIEETVKGNVEKYELINNNEAFDLIYDVIEEYYNTHDKVLSIEEAADYTEQYLEDEAKKLLALKKFQKEQPKVEAKKDSNKTQATLSNSMASELPVSNGRPKSREESLAEAAKLIRWVE